MCFWTSQWSGHSSALGPIALVGGFVLDIFDQISQGRSTERAIAHAVVISLGAAVGAGVGAVALSGLPVLGSFLGAVAGGWVGSMAFGYAFDLFADAFGFR